MADTQQRYRVIPLVWGDLKEHLRLIAERLNGILRAGQINATGEVTLDSGATTTTVTRSGVVEKSVVCLTPVSANAASANVYVTCTLGSFTLHHALGITSAAFRYVFFG